VRVVQPTRAEQQQDRAYGTYDAPQDTTLATVTGARGASLDGRARADDRPVTTQLPLSAVARRCAD
jgi:hypothetical protein